MDDTRCRTFFTQPTNPYQRRYEALRAMFVDGRSPKDVSEQFGLAYSSVRQLRYEFRQHCHGAADGSPFFASPTLDDLPPPAPAPGPARNSPPSPIAAN
jgi:hypothetical protein